MNSRLTVATSKTVSQDAPPISWIVVGINAAASHAVSCR
jgi:hypothetical protein